MQCAIAGEKIKAEVPSSPECVTESEPGAGTALSSVLGAPGRCEPWEVPWEAQQSLHIITHLVRTLLLQESSGNRTRAALKGKGLEKWRAGLFVLPLHLHHHTGEDHPLDLLLLSSESGGDPRDSSTHQVVSLALAAVFGPGQWCQDDTEVLPTNPVTTVGWLCPRAHPSPRTSHVCSCPCWCGTAAPPPDELCSAQVSSVLNPVQHLQASLVLGEGTHCLWSTPRGQISPDLTFDRFTH